MAIIKRNRILRPSSREPQSTYKIDTSKVGINDTLYVTITHEDNAEFKKVYIFDGKDLVDKNSIHFSYDEECIKWLDNLIYNEVDTIDKEERDDVQLIKRRKPTKKSFMCPHCGCENKLYEDHIKYRYLNCGWCNNTIENQYIKNKQTSLTRRSIDSKQISRSLIFKREASKNKLAPIYLLKYIKKEGYYCKNN